MKHCPAILLLPVVPGAALAAPAIAQSAGGPSATAFPSRMEVDYVRVHQKQ